MIFKDRFDAAEKLLPLLEKFKNKKNTMIVAVPRGALEIGYVLSKKLNLPLDIVVTKKIPAPGNPELAIGAVAPDGQTIVNKNVVPLYGIDEDYINKVQRTLLNEIGHRYKSYKQGGAKRCGNKSFIPSFKNETVILIDDGIATGFTIKAAIAYLRREKAEKVILAVPVSSVPAAKEMEELADEFICLDQPQNFTAVAQFFDSFPQVSDSEAIKYLKEANSGF